MAPKSKIHHEIQHQPGASLDKVIDDISSKLALLSGQDCEIEVNIRVKFPKSSSSSSIPKSAKRSNHPLSKPLERSRYPRKHHPQQQQQNHHPSSPHKLRDFVFDVESFAKVDASDSPSAEHIPLANAIKRSTSPDIVTLGGLCNEGESDTNISGLNGDENGAKNSSCVGVCRSRSASTTATTNNSASPSTSSTTISTNQLFPKGAIRYVQHK